MLRFMCLVCFLLSMNGCFTELKGTKEIDGGMEKDAETVQDALSGDDASDSADSNIESDAEEGDVVVIEDATPLARDGEVVETDVGLIIDAAQVGDALPIDATPPPVLDASPPVPDVGLACGRDSDCGAGQLCLEDQCQSEDNLRVWCWDHNPPDGRPTCHNVAGYSSPEVWRLGEYPNQPPACQGPTADHFPVAECCRGSETWNDEESEDFRVCEPQPDGGPSTWNPYNN